ncbi:MAG: ABC transporter permease, partial [Acidobacteria bacterium]|nr:ABC transporter permease [Acidobacteriota bacterium]
MTPGPPRVCTAVLHWTLAAESAEEIVGDLHEEFDAVAAARGIRAARRWYGSQVARLAGRALFHRATDGLRRRRSAVASRHADVHTTNPGDSVMRSLLVETRQSVRTLIKRPALSGLVIITLALGLGANAAIFAVLDALILRPFTIPEIGRLVMVAETEPGNSADTRETVSPANFADWKKQTDAFEHLAAFEWWDVNLAGRDEAERVSGFYVTSNFFAALGVQPALGRTFTADEETRGNHRRVILSHDLWERRFAGDRQIVGRTVLLDAEQFEIVGIAPAGFAFPLGTDLWAPLALDAKGAARRDSRYLSVIGRLAAGRTLDDGKAQMAVVGDRLERQYPEVNKGRGVKVLTLVQGMRDQGLGPIV